MVEFLNLQREQMANSYTAFIGSSFDGCFLTATARSGRC